MRQVYSAILWLLTPVFLSRLAWRSLRNPDYRRRWGERLAFGLVPAQQGMVWIHAVSVGEVRAALPLIQALREHEPEHTFLLTTTTPTGSALARETLGNSVVHSYLPWDLPFAVTRFLAHYRPARLFVMETEIWPNLYHACRQRDIPVVIANARLSPASARGYRRLGTLIRRTLDCVNLIATQSDEDAQRFASLGADPKRVRITGNLKFDQAAPNTSHGALRRSWGIDRPVWIAASTHTGENEIVLDAFRRVRASHPDCVLMLAPRHPERSREVLALAAAGDHSVCLHSAGTPDAHTDVYLVDTLGDLPGLYVAADVAFVGGSLVPIGGHNLLEPAALGIPVITGPHLFSIGEANRLLSGCGALREVTDAAGLAGAVSHWLSDPEGRATSGGHARRAVETNRGAVKRLLSALEPD